MGLLVTVFGTPLVSLAGGIVTGNKIMAWHPFAGKVEIEIEVKEGPKTQTNLGIKK